MNYPEQTTGNVVHDSMAATANHHYFDVREVDDVGSQIRQQLEDIQTTILSQVAVEFRTIHERLDALEDKLNEAFGLPSTRTIQARLSGLESKFSDFLGTPPSRTPLQNNPNRTPTSIQSTIPQTPTPPTHLTPAQARIIRTPASAQLLTTHTNLTPVSQLPSEENAKVKVLLRQFAAKAMNYIEKNAVSYTNVNNNVGAITTMKKFEIYDSPAWDQFVEMNFPHVQKNDLKDELVKIVSVKVKNTKARFKKRLSESHQTQHHLQQSQLHPQQAQQHPSSEQEQAQHQSPQYSDAMSDGIMTPPTKRICTSSPLDIKNPITPNSQTPHQTNIGALEKNSVINEAHLSHLQNNSHMVAPVSIHLQQPSETMIQDQTQF